MHLVFYPKEEIIIKELADYIYKICDGKQIKSSIVKNEIKKHPYIPSSYYNKAMKLLEKDNKIISVIKPTGEKARKGNFPDESNITFISSKSKEIMV